MAVIQYSALVTQLRGKLGGSQFNKGHAGYSLQRKSTPTIRQTPAQLAQRQNISIIQRGWALESPARQSEALQAAMANPVSNRLGQQVTLTGYNHYVKMMSWRLLGAQQRAAYPIADYIRTNPSVAMQMGFAYLAMEVSGYDANLGTHLIMSGTRERVWSGGQPSEEFRMFVYITSVDEFGRVIGARRATFLTRFVTVPGSIGLVDVYTGKSSVYTAGGYALVEVRTRNLAAGAEVGYWSQIIQLQ